MHSILYAGSKFQSKFNANTVISVANDTTIGWLYEKLGFSLKVISDWVYGIWMYAESTLRIHWTMNIYDKLHN